jgi:hypothetical protein
MSGISMVLLKKSQTAISCCVDLEFVLANATISFFVDKDSCVCFLEPAEPDAYAIINA